MSSVPLDQVDPRPCFCLILAESDAWDLGEWVQHTVEAGLTPPMERTALVKVDPSPNTDHDTRLLHAGEARLGELFPHNTLEPSNAPRERETSNTAAPNPTAVPFKCVCLTIAIFWDGQSESVKAEFIRLRQLTERHPHVQFIFQALNSKKGTHTLRSNRDALVSSLRRKLPNGPSAPSAPAAKGAAHTSSPPAVHADPMGETTAAEAFGATDLSASAIARAVEEGQGECFLLIAAPNTETFAQRVAQLRASTDEIGAGCMPVVDAPREVPNAPTGNVGGKSKRLAQEFLIRQSDAGAHMELRLAMCGNVDSGKSTLTSVLTRGCRDDGRGFARAFVFNHKHEAATGRTSSVSENHLGLSSTGEVVNYAVATAHGKLSAAHLTQEVVAQSAKVLTLYDLAGHERYLKTTVLGMTRNLPDYGCVVISANNGIQRMTKEHIALCLALKIPFFIVVTRIDSTPDNVRQETMTNIHKLLKIPTVRKLPYPVRRVDDIVLSAKNLRSDRITPIFELSNVTGEGLQELIRFLNLLPMRKDWRKARAEPREMVIDSTFFVTGVGTVVGGIVTQGVFRVNDSVLLGPDSFGAYRAVTIKSIHVKGVEQPEAVAGCDAAFCLKKEKRSAIRKGNILADPRHPVRSYWQFEADVTILYHSTTILVNYEPVIHSTTVRQSARIVFVAQEVLRTGDRSLVRFHFLYRPEFMKVGQQLIFREGRTKGIGTVTKVMETADESLLKKRKR